MKKGVSAIRLLKILKEKIYMLRNYCFVYPVISKKFQFRILTWEETVDRILSEKCSVCRYGDGEFELMKMHSIGFQHADPVLKDALYETLHVDDPGVMICLTEGILSTNGLRMLPALYCRTWTVKNRKFIRDVVPAFRTYGRTGFTRFYADWANKDHSEMQGRSIKLKKFGTGKKSI